MIIASFIQHKAIIWGAHGFPFAQGTYGLYTEQQNNEKRVNLLSATESGTG